MQTRQAHEPDLLDLFPDSDLPEPFYEVGAKNDFPETEEEETLDLCLYLVRSYGSISA